MSDVKYQVGPGFTGTLGITFIVLKLIEVIDWKWLWVLSPFWIPLVLIISIVLIIFVIIFFVELFNPGYVKKYKKKKDEEELASLFFEHS